MVSAGVCVPLAPRGVQVTSLLSIPSVRSSYNSVFLPASLLDGFYRTLAKLLRTQGDIDAFVGSVLPRRQRQCDHVVKKIIEHRCLFEQHRVAAAGTGRNTLAVKQPLKLLDRLRNGMSACAGRRQ